MVHKAVLTYRITVLVASVDLSVCLKLALLSSTSDSVCETSGPNRSGIFKTDVTVDILNF